MFRTVFWCNVQNLLKFPSNSIRYIHKSVTKSKSNVNFKVRLRSDVNLNANTRRNGKISRHKALKSLPETVCSNINSLGSSNNNNSVDLLNSRFCHLKTANSNMI